MSSYLQLYGAKIQENKYSSALDILSFADKTPLEKKINLDL
jgi:hypothetical protein